MDLENYGILFDNVFKSFCYSYQLIFTLCKIIEHKSYWARSYLKYVKEYDESHPDDGSYFPHEKVIDGFYYLDCEYLFYKSPLFMAIDMENINLIDALIENGASVNVATKYFETPLYLSFEKLNPEMFKYFLDKGCKINGMFDKEIDSEGYELMYAIMKSDMDIVEALLKDGPNEFCSYTKQGLRNALVYSSLIDNKPLVNLLIYHGAKMDTFDEVFIEEFHKLNNKEREAS